MKFWKKPKPKHRPGLSYAFTLSDGNLYYRFSDDFDMYLDRKGFIDTKLIEMESGLSRTELEKIIAAMETALTKPKPDYPMIGHLIIEMKNRLKWLVHGEIMIDILASTFIRHDEDPATFHPDIHNEKIEAFRKDMDAGFFAGRAIGELFPQLRNIGDSLKGLLKESIVESKALIAQTDQYSSGEELLSSKDKEKKV